MNRGCIDAIAIKATKPYSPYSPDSSGRVGTLQHDEALRKNILRVESACCRPRF